MSKKKVSVRKKVVINKKKNKTCLSWLLYILGVLVILAALFFIYNGITGNAFRSFDIGNIQSAASQIEPVLQFFLGEGGYSSDNLFERFLFFLIILAMVFVSLKRVSLFERQRNIVILISLIVSILSIRYINFEWLMTSIMSYTVLGVAIISFLPFMIFFLFLNGIAPNSSLARKVGWALFIAIYIGLYYNAADRFYGQVYIWTAVISGLFLLFDGTIHRAWVWQKVVGSGHTSIDEAARAIRRKMVLAKKDKADGVITDIEYDKEMDILQDNLKMLYKHSF